MCQTPVLGLGLGVDFINFIFAWDNNNNNNNPHRNFLKETVLGEDQGIGDKGWGARDKGIRPKLCSTLKTKSC